LRVAVAADLSPALPELNRAFAARHGETATFILGSSGLLARQLAEGAPFDLFLAADEAFADQAIRSGACDGESKRGYARGRLAVWWSRVNPAPRRLQDLADARFRRVALANPTHAPYGRAAEQALGRIGLLPALRPRLVFGENVKQALQHAQSGNAEVALVALSLARATKEGAFFVVDESLHDPLRQTLVVCWRGKRTALGRAFAEVVTSAEAQEILRRHGFGVSEGRGCAEHRARCP
jgi:molybdate transport system substrate-binding protein